MKKIILFLGLIITLSGCSTESVTEEYYLSLSEVDADLNQQVKNAFAEMGIIGEIKFKEVEDKEIEEMNAYLEEEGDGRIYLFETEYEGVILNVVAGYYNEEWTLSSVYDDTKEKAFWATENSIDLLKIEIYDTIYRSFI